jgi:valyl-tRNA synthetase
VRTLEHREALLERGEQLTWHPDYMKHRYKSWVEGLNTDWNISRQRFFGVPFPVWYRLDESGEPLFDSPLLPALDALPIDPSSEVPAGFDESQRDVPGGFTGDPDVMDTWATSSLSPQIAGQWGTDLFERVFPMDVRPQAHEIIRTWLFSTVVRSHLEHNSLPFRHATISGWVLDPDRKKMSKSAGNAVTPIHLLESHGADALRYWAASGRPGADTAIDESQMKIGRRLAIKVLNASKFVLGRLGEGATPPVSAITEPLDLDLCAVLATLIEETTAAFESFDYARALERTEAFFWSFCDDYVELVKVRAYGADDNAATASARATLALALVVVQRLLAPFMPFVTEEVWSWWQVGSVHRAAWPTRDELPAQLSGSGALCEVVSEVLSHVRREKTNAKVSQRAAVSRCVVTDSPERLDLLKQASSDLAQAGSIDVLELREGESQVTLELAPVE